MIEVLVPLAIAAGATLLTSLRVLREYERAVVFRLGRLTAARGPGLIFLLPWGIERMVRTPLRIVAMDVPPQDVITRDNVSVKVNAVIYFRVSDPIKATVVIQDYLFATSQLAQTTLRAVVGQAELDQLLAERDHFNDIVRRIIDEGTDPWGIDVTAVELKDIDLPQEMRRAIARQAEAERERRAKVINAEGELQASRMLTEAAAVIGREPAAIQLRFLQTVSEIATENNSTTLFPIPIDIFRPFFDKAVSSLASGRAESAEQSAEREEEDPKSLPGPQVEAALPEALHETVAARRKSRGQDST
ncbi:MAG: slipin family protein [Gemmatimonadota bacterium]|jgi:regulator of protease activity HflC (stomatin/prohibitin superfamily)